MVEVKFFFKDSNDKPVLEVAQVVEVDETDPKAMVIPGLGYVQWVTLSSVVRDIPLSSDPGYNDFINFPILPGYTQINQAEYNALVAANITMELYPGGPVRTPV